MAQEVASAEAQAQTQIRHVAKLARLQLSDAEVATYARQLGAVLEHMALLKNAALNSASPQEDIHPDRLGPDEPGTMLNVTVLTDMAPAKDGPFVSVPKVLGDGGGA